MCPQLLCLHTHFSLCVRLGQPGSALGSCCTCGLTAHFLGLGESY